jgi:hypothetical protein
MELLSALVVANFLGLILGASSRYLGFGRDRARDLPPHSRVLIIPLIFLWLAAPIIAFFSLIILIWAAFAQKLDIPFEDETVLCICIALWLQHGCITFAIGWLAGSEADTAYRPRNPFQEDVPPVFLFQPNRDGDNNWLDAPVEKDEAA